MFGEMHYITNRGQRQIVAQPKITSHITSSINSLADLVNDLTGEADNYKAFPHLKRMIDDSMAYLALRQITPILTRQEMVWWTILEILDTDVGIDEVFPWLQDEITLHEIISYEHKDSIVNILIQDVKSAQKRINFLIKKHL
jgi:hypothetical protein